MTLAVQCSFPVHPIQATKESKGKMSEKSKTIPEFARISSISKENHPGQV
jgi:hypothetical protein